MYNMEKRFEKQPNESKNTKMIGSKKYESKKSLLYISISHG